MAATAIPQFDQLMQRAGEDRGIDAQRMQLMHEAEQIAIDDDAWIPIYYYVSKALVSQKLEGYVDNTKHIHRVALDVDSRNSAMGAP